MSKVSEQMLPFIQILLARHGKKHELFSSQVAVWMQVTSKTYELIQGKCQLLI